MVRHHCEEEAHDRRDDDQPCEHRRAKRQGDGPAMRPAPNVVMLSDRHHVTLYSIEFCIWPLRTSGLSNPFALDVLSASAGSFVSVMD